MRSLSIPIKVSRAVLGAVVLLAVSCTDQVKSPAAQTLSLGDAKAAQPAGIPTCDGRGPSQVEAHPDFHSHPHPHSVTLSWNASVPASNSARDAIKGYYVYRSLKSHTYAERNKISESLLQGTRCVDARVEARKTYFYVVKAVTEAGTQSNSSIETKAVVPFP